VTKVCFTFALFAAVLQTAVQTEAGILGDVALVTVAIATSVVMHAGVVMETCVHALLVAAVGQTAATVTAVS